MVELSRLAKLKLSRMPGTDNPVKPEENGSESGEDDEKQAPHEALEARLKASNEAIDARMEGFQSSLQDLEKRFARFETLMQAIAAKLGVEIPAE